MSTVLSSKPYDMSLAPERWQDALSCYCQYGRDDTFVQIALDHLLLIHCFPSANPVGIIVDPDTDRILASVGELAQDKYQSDAHKNPALDIINWYIEETKECCSYQGDWWYPDTV